jgi:hypothetical protein
MMPTHSPQAFSSVSFVFAGQSMEPQFMFISSSLTLLRATNKFKWFPATLERQARGWCLEMIYTRSDTITDPLFAPTQRDLRPTLDWLWWISNPF